ncbi:MAG: SRPBCC domain-containing protein [Alphaproteobacteria bacterium]|nr:SRPBCC domain-containing protein [Alphaproteobacteria bacterium]
MSEMNIVKTIFLKAPPEHVWKFLTEADRLAEWFHRGGADLVEGGDYTLLTNSYGKEGEKLLYGKVLEANKPERLVHTFTHEWLKGVETTCTWTLEGVGGGTVLTLVHEGWDKVDEDGFGMAADHDKGWDEHFARLRSVTS